MKVISLHVEGKNQVWRSPFKLFGKFESYGLSFVDWLNELKKKNEDNELKVVNTEYEWSATLKTINQMLRQPFTDDDK